MDITCIASVNKLQKCYRSLNFIMLNAFKVIGGLITALNVDVNVKNQVECNKKTAVDYNCRELLKHDSGAGERKRERFKG